MTPDGKLRCGSRQYEVDHRNIDDAYVRLS